MNTTEITITTNPAVLTVGQVSNSGLRVARDGIKDDIVLEQLETVMSAQDAQTIVSTDSSNSAVTVRVTRDSLDRMIKTLSNMAIAGNQVIASCVTQLRDALAKTGPDDLAELNRGNLASIATMRHEIEEDQTNNTVTASLARMVMLPAAGPEWVSHANVDNIETVVNTINESLNSSEGTDLLRNAVDSVPTDIGLAANGTTIREGAISLDSQAAVRPVMQNQGQDIITEQYLAAIDAFSSCDAAVTPLADMVPLIEMAKNEAMVQNSPYAPPALILTKDDATGFVTDVAYDIIAPLTEEDLASLDMTKSLAEQDFSAVEQNLERTEVVSVYTVHNCDSIPFTITKEQQILQMYPSKRFVSGPQAASILGAVGKLWNTFKNHTGASNANIASIIGVGANLAGHLIGGATGTTISQLGRFVQEGTAAFAGGDIPESLNAKKMFLNYIPNLGRLVKANNNKHTVSSTVTATAVERFGKEFMSSESAIPAALRAQTRDRKVRILKSKFSK